MGGLMNLSDCAIEQFLAKLEANSNGSDSAGAVAQFADMFLAAGPDGSMLVRARDFRLERDIYHGRL